MNHPISARFVELLMTRVRDKAIGDWERMIAAEMKGVSGEEIRTQIALFTADQRNELINLVPQIVDTTVHHLLFTLEQDHDVEVLVNDSNGGVQNVREISNGLAGELSGNHGWVARFSAKSKEHI